ncbi:hypothetical protein ACFSR6_03445 [Pedobacter vanadiisoli]|uniref:Uncharacterized protein n=1 Tax=Pedobacter vanadiisoli TaxID=1761975 RepID=A0ABW5MIG4_9SPHI
MTAKNNIKEILYTRGFRDFKPTRELLDRIGTNAWRFKKIIDNKLEMTLSESAEFAGWLGTTVDDLIQPNNTEPPLGKSDISEKN